MNWHDGFVAVGILCLIVLILICVVGAVLLLAWIFSRGGVMFSVISVAGLCVLAVFFGGAWGGGVGGD